MRKFTNEEVGQRGELLFRTLLDINHVPYLPIDSEPEKFSRALDDIHACRPDFAVFPKDIGSVLFDVKARRLRELEFDGEKKKTECFKLELPEFEKLVSLQKKCHAPVWLALLDSGKIKEERESMFFIISLSSVMEFHSITKDFLSKRNGKTIENCTDGLLLPIELMRSFKMKEDFHLPMKRNRELFEKYGILWGKFLLKHS